MESFYTFNQNYLKQLEVLFVTHHPPFDPRIYHKMFCSLKKHGFDVRILLPNQKSLSEKNNYFISFNGFSGFWLRVFNDILLLMHCFFLKPRLIIFFDPNLLPFMIFYRFFSNSSIIYDNHEDYPSYMLQKKRFPKILRWFIRRLYLLIERIGLELFDHVFYADPFTFQHYHGHLHHQKEKISIIYNYPILKGYNGKSKVYDVIYPGSLDSLYDRILKIAKEIDVTYKLKIKFIIIGRIVSLEIKNKIDRASNESKNVEIIYKEDLGYEVVQEYISKTKIGIIPLAPLEKFHRNIPTKMFEYMMHSIPQLASDLPPISFYLNKIKSGFCVSEENYAEKYAKKINDILDNYDQYSKYAKQGKHFLFEKWNWIPLQEDKLVKIVNQILNNSKN